MSEAKDSRHHRSRPGRSCCGGPCARARHEADRAGGRRRASRTRSGNGATCSCSRRGNTISTARPSGCCSRPDGIRPDPQQYPTGAELVERYLEPLATRTALAGHIRTSSRVTDISRVGFDKLKSKGRESAPFEIRYQNGKGPEVVRADAVIDASGTWHSPNPAGANGLPAIGERPAKSRIAYGMPDVLGKERARYAGKTVAVLGAGHSAHRHVDRSGAARRTGAGHAAGLAAARQRSRQGVRRRRQ